MQDLKMPVKTRPFEHQKRAWEFVCKLFEIEEIEGDLNSKDGQIKMHSMREDVFEKRSRN